MTSERPAVKMPGALSLSDRQIPAGHGQPGASGTGEIMVSGSGSMVLPGGIINPQVPIRNIKMKFAVLIGLIQVGEVSNRDIVETVLNLVRKYKPFQKQHFTHATNTTSSTRTERYSVAP